MYINSVHKYTLCDFIRTYIALIYPILQGAWKSFTVCKTKLLFTGKHSWLDSSLIWPTPIVQAISLEMFCGYQSIRGNRKTFPPRTICNIQ